MHHVRTFIVEDSPIILLNLVGMLEELAPVQVVGTAADEGSANRRLEELADDVDLVIVDIFLKSGSGMGVLQGARQAGLKASIVVLTNYASPDLRLRCTTLGAHRVFDKSQDIEALVDYCTRLAGTSAGAAAGGASG
jgi:DNA-binding NarL/FixJ family response regulator